MQTTPPQAVPFGPRAYRARIRRLGPWAGLAVPAALGLLAAVLGGIVGFLLALLAAPALLVVGVPLSSGAGVWIVALLGSALLWLLLATVATRRATRSPVATWADFWRQYAWLAGGVWLGTLLALVAANLLLGRTLL
ncbi:MAG: hypothetical protein KGR47_07005 [Acidobacteria bacterium]|nr:hypothetical protein [Acidobacteriota bacterium]